jgi:hypothetical protein
MRKHRVRAPSYLPGMAPLAAACILLAGCDGHDSNDVTTTTTTSTTSSPTTTLPGMSMQ